MREIFISERESGQRLDKYLRKYLCEAGSGFIYKMLRKKNIVLNGKKASGNEIINDGDLVKLFLSDETIEKFTNRISANSPQKSENFDVMKNKLNNIIVNNNSSTGVVTIKYRNYATEVLYEDDNIIFFNKPAGLLSQKAAENDISLVDIFSDYIDYSRGDNKLTGFGYRPGICNRLDRNTSGIVAAGKSVKGLQCLSEVIKNREVSKFYRCIVHGAVTKPGYLKGYLIKDEETNKVYLSDSDTGEKKHYIETGYKPICSNDNYSLLEVKLITGKTHQIRAHLASISHPIVGDIKYGAPRDNSLKHHLLHAYEMRFDNDCGYTDVLSGVAGKGIIAPMPKAFNDYMKHKLGGVAGCHPGIHED